MTQSPAAPDLTSDSAPAHFIRQIIDGDLAAGKYPGGVVTRFPPEPNGFLHIGHAKSICLNFGLAGVYRGNCFMRFDDTNPSKESNEYAEAILRDVRWLGFDWGDRLTHASDYFERLYQYACDLVRGDRAYVCSLSAEEIRQFRGSLTEPGRNSPYRDRSVEENLDLFARMRAGEFADGTHVLRAKIDMAAPNINMRDPTIYRIRNLAHQRTGDAWHVYPMYDFAHGLSDAIEGVTHSLCTLEFEDHRPLYDWFIENIDVPHVPHQYEFARLNLNYTVTSKRKLNGLVTDGHVADWDDPRLPTLAGLRRRGFPPAAIRAFCDRIGVTKKETIIDMGVLEGCVREVLDATASRVMAVLNPLKVVIENYPEDTEDIFDAPYHPQDESFGTRPVPFAREIYIEREDFMLDPPKKFFRLGPGREVRLRYAYYITCTDVVTDPATGEVIEVRCQYDPATRGGWSEDGRKVKGTLHWASARHALKAEVRLYDRLFNVPAPGGDDRDLADDLNPDSLQVIDHALVEPSLASARVDDTFQFERLGYFRTDQALDADSLIFNRAVTLRDSWAKQTGKSPSRSQGRA